MVIVFFTSVKSVVYNKIITLINIFPATCTNCRVPINGGDLCLQCTSRRQCSTCKRRLTDSLFEGASSICKTCHRKDVSSGRVAFGGLAKEVVIPTNSEADLPAFIGNHSEIGRASCRERVSQ